MTAAIDRFTFLVTGAGMEHIEAGSLCYRLPGFPPPSDFPVMVDLGGEAVSYYGDHKWRIGGALFNFGTKPSDLGPNGLMLTDANGDLLKRCLCWFMYGDRPGVKVGTIETYHSTLKPIFSFCSTLQKPIAASDLSRFFDTLEEGFAQAIRPSRAWQALSLLHELWLAREHLGFTLLNPDQIARLKQLIPEHEVRQTQFIPLRIWAYQAERMQAFLGDFLAQKNQFELALKELLDAYRCNFGSLADARGVNSSRNPCSTHEVQIRGCTYLGSFATFAERHGIHEVLARWMFQPGSTWGDLKTHKTRITLLSKYLSTVGFVGTAYLQCFSGMRISESMSLRCDCLSVEHDPLLGDVHILSGETAKTTEDDDARWLSAPTVALAVEAMSTVSRWRTDIVAEYRDVPLTDEDRVNPYLIRTTCEPWTRGGLPHMERSSTRKPEGYEIHRWAERVPGLFEEGALRISAEDEAYVRRFSANADFAKFGEGCVWYLTSHQYRRTAAVMMGSSQVSIESQQYQFKHLTRNQSAYYRRGFQNLRLNRTFTYELIEARFELVSVDLGLLNGPEYVSPISPARKNEILNFHEISDGDALQRAIKKGHLAVKQTLFGVCTRRDNCPYGGHDNYAHCPDCNDALLSKRKRGNVEKLGKAIAVRLVDAPQGTPLRAQLERSSKAIERFMNVTA